MKLLLIPTILLIGFFSLTSTSCKHEDDPKEVVYLSDSLKAYCDFQVGSYWVYQDSVSKELDSVYIYKRKVCIRLNTSSYIECGEGLFL